MNARIFKITLSAVAGLLAFSAMSAKAISYTLNAPNAALSGYTGAYGTVDISLTDSTHATITFTGATVGGYQFLFSGAQMADVNLNASSFNVSVVSPSTAVTPVGSGNVSEFGKFNVAIDNDNGGPSATGTVKFDVTDLSGTWADASSVLIANDKNFIAAAHIFAIDIVTGDIAVTGFTANATSTRVVPDGGSTVALLGAALLSLGALRRKMAKMA
jgi:hypothetical protein